MIIEAPVTIVVAFAANVDRDQTSLKVSSDLCCVRFAVPLRTKYTLEMRLYSRQKMSAASPRRSWGKV